MEPASKHPPGKGLDELVLSALFALGREESARLLSAGSCSTSRTSALYLLDEATALARERGLYQGFSAHVTHDRVMVHILLSCHDRGPVHGEDVWHAIALSALAFFEEVLAWDAIERARCALALSLSLAQAADAIPLAGGLS